MAGNSALRSSKSRRDDSMVSSISVRLHSFLAFTLFLSTSVNLSGQCIDTADFTKWTETNGNNHWLVASPHEVSQNIEIMPPHPSFFVSDQQFINTRFSFDVESVNGLDNDFIGFVVGYKNPSSMVSDEYSFILFDWRANTEVAFSTYAEEGLTLSAFHGNINTTSVPLYFWGHNGTLTNSVYEHLAHGYGEAKGWEVSHKYHFEVLYMATSIKIYIDNNLVFDVERCNQPGKIGFYTYSQYKVKFRNLTFRNSADIIASPSSICAGDTVFTSLLKPSCPDYNPVIESWQWNWGDGENSVNKPGDYHIYPTGGSYTLELIANFAGNCSDTVSTVISVQSPPLFDLGPDMVISPAESVTLTAGDYHYNWSYLWSTGNQLSQITLFNLDRDTLVSLLVTNGLCQAYDEIAITVFQEPIPEFHLNVPNAFTPDGDGENDTFKPVTDTELQDNYKLFIYDRWGTEIFRSSQLGIGWDGTYNGRQCQGDMYVYLVKYQPAGQFQTGSIQTKKGCLMLLRYK